MPEINAKQYEYVVYEYEDFKGEKKHWMGPRKARKPDELRKYLARTGKKLNECIVD